MKNLSDNGLSMTQAQTISNACFQRCVDIQAIFNSLNNYSTTIEYNGKELTEIEAHPIPSNILDLIKEKGELHATQAFLMENIKYKDVLINNERNKTYVNTIQIPDAPEYKNYKLEPNVDEAWGWAKLSTTELNEYIEHEAHASHIGQFIHKNSPLSKLRTELPNITKLKWFEINKDSKVPVIATIHNTPEALLELHNKLSDLHREHEQKVNYFKAKVKNLVTLENARIANDNANNMQEVDDYNTLLRNEWTTKYQIYVGENNKQQQLFEKTKLENIKKYAALKINVDPRFQPIIDKYKTK